MDFVTGPRMSGESLKSRVTLHPRAVIGSGGFLPRKKESTSEAKDIRKRPSRP